MDRIIPICSALALFAQPALAQTDDAALSNYVAARVLSAEGNGGMAAQAFALALSSAPAEERIATRAYRQAVDAGDLKLAIRAAQALDVSQKLPGDGRVLLYVDALNRGDWRNANLQLDKIEENGNFDFLAPIFRAWVQYASRDGDPLTALDGRARSSLTAAYAREQRTYLLLALKRNGEGATAARAMASPDNRGVWVRLAAASRLAALKDRDAALALLEGNDTTLSRARALVSEGKSLPGAVATASDGCAVLLARVAADLIRDNAGPTALTLARLASFAAPTNEQVRLVLAQALSTSGYQQLALAELERLGSNSLFEPAIREIRFTALQRTNRHEDALTQAKSDVAGPDTDLFDHARLGDAYSRLERHKEASASYQAAIDAVGKRGEASWNLWLLMGGQLEAAGDWPNAKAALKKAVSLAPDQPVALNHLGYSMLEHKDDIDEATRLIARAAALRPDDPAITDSLGWAFFLRGQTTESILILERAVASDPTVSALSEHLGDAYWAAGRRIDARYSWRAALVQAETDKEIARLNGKIADGPKPR